MLVLSRKNGEAVLVGDDFFVHVVEIRGSRVLLGFDGPKQVRVQRAEIVGKPKNDEPEE